MTIRASRATSLALPGSAIFSIPRRGLTGSTVLAIITSIACLLAVVAVVVMIGLLPPEDLAQLGRMAQ